MDNAELGKRLKAARLAKKMTQSDVVGTFITRNMLSQIESGTATPSMKTLEYLAGVLEIPMDRLLSGQSESVSLVTGTSSVLHQAKVLYQKEDYETLLLLEDENGEFLDELQALQTMSHLALAKAQATSEEPEDWQKALSHARKAVKLSECGIYANETHGAAATALVADIARLLSEYYSNLAQGSLPCTT